MNIEVRPATPDDLPSITEIYRHHVLYGTGSFEEVAPDFGEINHRYLQIATAELPYLVGAIDGKIVGFAYASSFRPRSAYRFTVEDSVYVDPDHAGKSVGKLLLQDLIRRCTALGFCRMVAVIGDGNNAASIGLHQSCGFVECGRLHNIGYKAERWLDIVMMQRDLNQDPSNRPPPALHLKF